MIALGIICFIIALIFLTVHLVFSRFTQFTEKTDAWMQNANHEENVRVHIRNKSYFYKDVTKAVYKYEVNQKAYVFKNIFFFHTLQQTPKRITVVYIKPFPKLSYYSESGLYLDSDYLFRCIITFIVSASLILSGIMFLLA